MARGLNEDQGSQAGLRTGYDPEREYQLSLTFDPTPGTKAMPLKTLSELREYIAKNPGSTVAVSDVHSQLERLRNSLVELGLLDPDAGERLNKGVELVQMGDLIDGRDALDWDTLDQASPWFDIIIAGNHETAYMNGLTFNGQTIKPELGHGLRRLAWEGKLKAAHASNGVVLSHGGLAPDFYSTNEADEPKAAQELADKVNHDWEYWLGRSGVPLPGLFATDGARSVASLMFGAPPQQNLPGGVFWQDWTTLIRSHDGPCRQIVGHSPRGRVEATLDEKVYNIDLAGARLGFAVISPEGKIVFGSDRI